MLDTKSCRYPRCGGEIKARGFCEHHYQRYKAVEVYFSKAEVNEGNPDPFTWHAVYAIGAHELPAIKIGRTQDVWRRLQQMQTGCPYTLRVFAAYFAKPATTVALEYEVHKVLTEYECKMTGEWFDIEPEDAGAVIGKCAQNRNLVAHDLKTFRGVIKGAGWSAAMERGWDDRLERAWLSFEGAMAAQPKG